MAKIKVEDVVDHLSTEFRKALEAVARKHFPDAHVDAHQLFRDFKREVYQKCSVWEAVPDSLVKRD